MTIFCRIIFANMRSVASMEILVFNDLDSFLFLHLHSCVTETSSFATSNTPSYPWVMQLFVVYFFQFFSHAGTVEENI